MLLGALGPDVGSAPVNDPLHQSDGLVMKPAVLVRYFSLADARVKVNLRIDRTTFAFARRVDRCKGIVQVARDSHSTIVWR